MSQIHDDLITQEEQFYTTNTAGIPVKDLFTDFDKMIIRPEAKAKE